MQKKKYQKHIVNPGFQQQSKQANLSDHTLTKGQYIKVANQVISQHLWFYLPTDEITKLTELVQLLICTQPGRLYDLFLIEAWGKQVQRQPFWESMERNDREPGSFQKGLSIKRPIVSYSAIIKADEDEDTVHSSQQGKNKGI